MKVFFGESLDAMIRELRARGVDSVRVHALGESDANSVAVTVHATTLCGGQIYEARLMTRRNLQNVDPAEEADFVDRVLEEEREKVIKKFSGFDIRRGILQQ
jgi:hypothetical protein